MSDTQQAEWQAIPTTNPGWSYLVVPEAEVFDLVIPTWIADRIVADHQAAADRDALEVEHQVQMTHAAAEYQRQLVQTGVWAAKAGLAQGRLDKALADRDAAIAALKTALDYLKPVLLTTDEVFEMAYSLLKRHLEVSLAKLSPMTTTKETAE